MRPTFYPVPALAGFAAPVLAVALGSSVALGWVLLCGVAGALGANAVAAALHRRNRARRRLESVYPRHNFRVIGGWDHAAQAEVDAEDKAQGYLKSNTLKGKP